MVKFYFVESFKRGMVQMVRRPMYILMMVIIPLLGCFTLMDLMKAGTIRRVPVGVVDMDDSELSHRLLRTMDAFQQVNIKHQYKDFKEAKLAVQCGDILGFYYIPEDLEKRTLSARGPVVSFYINYSYFAPASMQYKGFKTISLLTNAGIVQTTLRTVGLPSQAIMATMQPYNTHQHMPANPWLNYNYYLSTSFVPCFFALFILLLTAFSLGTELKSGLCRQWLAVAGDNMVLALTGKLIPQTVVFTSVGWFIQWLMYCVYDLPLNCNPLHMLVAMPMFVMANQGFAVLMFCVTPNFRFGSTLCTLMGMLSFSFCAFSLPEEAMYPWVAAIGYLVPMKYYFLLSVDQAVNGIDLYYSRLYYAALVGFVVLPLVLSWRIKRECLNPIYVP
ncbi:MAG: ABC transporter permease [Muribaculaceae bacterium]|nr:ABC transporter permease [Muribaculaceae bacterium]